MRTKRTVTRRIQVLKENRKKYARTSEIPVRDDAYREAVREYPEASVEEQYAYGFASLYRRMTFWQGICFSIHIM